MMLFDSVSSESKFMQRLLDLGRAISDPTRLRILNLLRGGDLYVAELADAIEAPLSSLSTHLQILRDTSLVESSRIHRWVSYRLSSDAEAALEGLWQWQGGLPHRAKRDAFRAGLRLMMRQGGCCCEGAGALDRSLEEGGTPMDKCTCGPRCACSSGSGCGCGCCGGSQ
jgi:ArsR family transcriptional regulator